ncbi:hypothetical protein GCM10025331_80790 [Actinoplanes utahensis]|nr:hypothetical protein Aut01nite_31130 [Actinoplanes utahensis]
MLLVAGVLPAFVGAVWTLQGLGVLGGSSMTGDTTWALIGPVAALLGAALIVAGFRHSRRR